MISSLHGFARMPPPHLACGFEPRTSLEEALKMGDTEDRKLFVAKMPEEQSPQNCDQLGQSRWHSSHNMWMSKGDD